MAKKQKKKRPAKKVKKKLPTTHAGMSKKDYLAALDQLGLTIAGKQTSKALGMGIRQCMRMAHGTVPVPRPVELLLQMYLKHGLEV